MPPKKREKPGESPQKAAGVSKVDSPHRNQLKKKLFTGEKPMEEDDSDAAALRRQRAENRSAAAAAAAAKGKQQNQGKGASNQKKDEADDETIVVEDASDEEATAKPAKGGRRGRSRSRSRTRVGIKDATAASQKGERKSRSRSLSRRRQKDVNKHGSGRGSSVPAKKGVSGGRGKRGKSVDSAFSTVDGAKGSDSSSGSSSGKRKPSPSPPEDSSATKKTAKFQEDIPNNEGKTASTKKQAKIKKKERRESYANKAEAEPKKEWIYSTIMTFDTRVGQCNDPAKEMYSRVSHILTAFQFHDKECAFGDISNAKSKSIRSPAEMATWKNHVPFLRHFALDYETDWQWQPVKGDKPRNFKGAFVLLSDKTPEEILRYTRVDLQRMFKGSVAVKQMQEIHTSVDLVVLGMHGNTHSESVAHDFRVGLAKAEADLIARKKLFEDEGLGIRDHLFDSVDFDWKGLDFPEILGVRSYPRLGPYEEGKKGEDTSWKLAQHFQTVKMTDDRVDTAITEFKRSGGMERLFGSQAILVRISEITRGGKDEYNNLIYTHQRINRSVGSVTMPGAIDMDAEVTMTFEPGANGNVRTLKTMTLRDIVRRLYVKIGGRKIQVFLYAFKTPQNHYQLWFYDTLPPIREFVAVFARQGPAYIWHQCRIWGWHQGPMKRLFQASFTPAIGHSAMNSKWCSRRKCAIEIEMSPEAAALLNFGSSPFILKDGEDKASRHKTETKGVISRGNIKPDEIGGMDADDLASVGDMSNAQTVLIDDDDEAEYEDDDLDDDVSSMGDEVYDDYSDDEEETVVKDDEADEYMEEDLNGGDDDSAFSTVDGRQQDLDGLKEQGRDIHRGAREEALRDRIEELEEEKKLMEEQMNQKVSALEQMFQSQMNELMTKLAKKGVVNSDEGIGNVDQTVEVMDTEETMDATAEHSRPGDVVAGSKEGNSSSAASGNIASAGVK